MKLIKYFFKEDICPYCLRAKLHARRHGNSADYVLCTPHRILNWWTSNAYHNANVEHRNPFSAGSYQIPVFNKEGIRCFSDLEKEEIKKFYKLPPKFAFSVIADTDPMLVSYTKKGAAIFYPSVIADVQGGEYENRRFAVIFGILSKTKNHYEWGLLESQIDYIFSYLGYSEIGPRIDTCVYRGAVPNLPAKDVRFYKQRTRCPECKK